MIKVGLAGGRGYVGEELLRVLQGIPEYQVVYIGSRSWSGTPVAEQYNDLDLDLSFQDLSHQSIRDCSADAWILAQPNGQAQALVETLSGSNAKIVDISSDFRFDDHWTYGLPEMNLDEIRLARQVANPGCYATATSLALLPHLDQLVGTPVAFGVSGCSGAGRTPCDKNDPDRLQDNIIPYSLTGHTHELEVSRHMACDIRFMPHVASFFRGITVTVNLQFDKEICAAEIHERTIDYYSNFPMVDIVETIPEIPQVINTNRALIGGFSVDTRSNRHMAIVCVIDNLRKGAASQAIQNLNLMFGRELDLGLCRHE